MLQYCYCLLSPHAECLVSNQITLSALTVIWLLVKSVTLMMLCIVQLLALWKRKISISQCCSHCIKDVQKSPTWLSLAHFYFLQCRVKKIQQNVTIANTYGTRECLRHRRAALMCQRVWNSPVCDIRWKKPQLCTPFYQNRHISSHDWMLALWKARSAMCLHRGFTEYLMFALPELLLMNLCPIEWRISINTLHCFPR